MPASQPAFRDLPGFTSDPARLSSWSVQLPEQRAIVNSSAQAKRVGFDLATGGRYDARRTSRLTCRAPSISSTMLAGCTQLSGTAVPSTSRINTPSPWSKPQHDPVHRQGRTPDGGQTADSCDRHLHTSEHPPRANCVGTALSNEFSARGVFHLAHDVPSCSDSITI